ncbi:hypothetical protein EVAR_79739_1 [Eumeta japonica]|uniref:Uncharacterized protein n=1 Tax=Eumeta variegata TaxID=151549 RepID=A0A4C1TC98_EUMVA|nr:hypothetical protein EVAR_79739_1 [Eumeta japonica]
MRKIVEESEDTKEKKDVVIAGVIYTGAFIIFAFNLHTREGMPSDCRDCLGIRYRINILHQTWKWLHQTIALHEYLISLSAADTDACYADKQ